jgi:RNA polymerase sigma factor (sigma-70 family)
MPDDVQLLRQYVETGSEPAFRELVERHIRLVNSTARRMVAGDTHLAQDVTQLVFTDLARKAAALPPGVVLGGWLHRHTCFTALKAIRTESRRRARERTAMELNSANDSSGVDAHWAQLAPVLDDALNRLDASDRDALVLRFLQQQDLRSVGQALGTSEDTAQKRVSRALDKLRALLTRRGVAVSSTALLASSLDAATVIPVPHGLAAAISAHALSTAAAGTGLTLLSLKTMSTSKLALGLVAAAAVASTTAIIIAHSGNNPPPSAAASVSAPAAVLPVPPILASNKVEAPKVAPAPAGDKPATPDDLAAIAASPTTSSDTGLAIALSEAMAGHKGNITITPTAMDEHSVSVVGDGSNVTYTIDGVSHSIPSGTPITVTDPDTGSTVSIDPVAISMHGSGGRRGGISGTSGPTGSMSRSVSIVNGQMTTTSTVNGVTTTTTSPTPPPGAVMTGSVPGDTQTMTMVAQNGVVHTIQVPVIKGNAGSGAVMITTNPDGTTNTLQTAPASGTP